MGIEAEMTPGGTSDEKLMVEQIERLGARRLAEIVVNHCHRDERLHQTVRIALAASTLGGPLATKATATTTLPFRNVTCSRMTPLFAASTSLSEAILIYLCAIWSVTGSGMVIASRLHLKQIRAFNCNSSLGT